MRWLKSIGNAIRLIVAYFLLVLATMLVIYFVAEFSSTVAVWALTSLFAAEAVAVGVFVGLAVLHGIGSVQRIIERMLPSQLYKIFRAGHFLRLTPHLILLIGFTILESFFIVIPISSRDSGNFGALAAETEFVQAAMYAMMEDKNITTVTPNDSTTGSLGVNTWTNLPVGPEAAALDGLLGRTTTHFYYCWDSKGNVYAQNKEDGVVAEPKDAEKQRPCKRAP